MATVATYGKMVENMKLNTKMIKSMAMELIHGLMAANMKAIGKMESSMGVGNMCLNRVFQEKEFGTRAKGRDGWKPTRIEGSNFFTYFSKYQRSRYLLYINYYNNKNF